MNDSIGLLRFDGLYQEVLADGKENLYWHYLRFYKNSVVVSASTSGTPEQVVKWLTLENKTSSRGVYELDNWKIEFFINLDHYGKKILYSGEVSEASLILNIYSEANDHKSKRTYKFVRFGSKEDSNIRLKSLESFSRMLNELTSDTSLDPNDYVSSRVFKRTEQGVGKGLTYGEMRPISGSALCEYLFDLTRGPSDYLDPKSTFYYSELTINFNTSGFAPEREKEIIKESSDDGNRIYSPGAIFVKIGTDSYLFEDVYVMEFQKYWKQGEDSLY